MSGIASSSGGDWTIKPYSTNDGSRVYYDAIVRTNSTFNLSSYKYIKALVSCAYSDPWFYIGVSTSPNITNKDSMTATALTVVGNTGILNVDSLTGNYYIYIGGRSNYLRNYAKEQIIETVFVTTS